MDRLKDKRTIQSAKEETPPKQVQEEKGLK